MQASNENESRCVESRNLFNELCPPTWVTHFDRKFQYEKFKANLAKSGIEEVDKKYTSNEKKEEKWKDETFFLTNRIC